MKRLILVAIFLFGGSVAQTKWVELADIPEFFYMSSFGDHIWGVGYIEPKEEEDREDFLFKFDSAKNSWSKISPLSEEKVDEIFALADGTCLVFYGEPDKKVKGQYNYTVKKIRVKGRPTVYKFKAPEFASTEEPPSIIATPDGAIFMKTEPVETKESIAAFNSVLAELEKEKPKLLEEAKKQPRFVGFMNSLKEGVDEGRIKKRVYDLINSALEVYDPSGKLEASEQEELRPIFDEIEKFEEEDIMLMRGALETLKHAFQWSPHRRKLLNKANKQRRYQQSIYRFFDGALKLIKTEELISSSPDAGPGIFAGDKGTLLIKNCEEHGREWRCFFDRWNGTFFDRVDIPKDAGPPSVGKNGSIYIFDKSQDSVVLKRLVKGKWEVVKTASGEPIKFHRVENISVNTPNDIWFLVEDKEWNKSLYHWDGKTVKKIKTPSKVESLKGRGGAVLIDDEDYKTYRWVE